MDILKNIKAIVFDAYGTLFNIGAIDERLQYHYGEKAMEIASVWRQKQLQYTWLRTLMERYRDFYALTADALRFACEQAGLPFKKSISNNLIKNYNQLRVYPEVGSALARLKKNYRLAILSNANPELLEGAVAFNHIGSYLEAVFSVDDLKVFKPSPGVYQIPVKGLKTPKEQILFVSSNTWDVAGAASYGLKVAWVKRRNQPIEQLGFGPDLTAGNLEELADQFQK